MGEVTDSQQWIDGVILNDRMTPLGGDVCEHTAVVLSLAVKRTDSASDCFFCFIE